MTVTIRIRRSALTLSVVLALSPIAHAQETTRPAATSMRMALRSGR